MIPNAVSHPPECTTAACRAKHFSFKGWAESGSRRLWKQRVTVIIFRGLCSSDSAFIFLFGCGFFFYVLHVILHFHGHAEACGRMLPLPSGS